MRKIFRSMMIALCPLGSAACAHDGMLTPELAPEPEPVPVITLEPERVLTGARTVVATGTVTAGFRCGISSIPPGGVPLYVVDGVMLDSIPAALDPGSIDRIEVVKGAAAVRMFGSRAEHGVILITTGPGQARSRS